MAPAAADIEDEIKDEKNPPPLDEDDIALLKTYGLGPYSTSIKKTEKEIKEMAKKINDLCGIKESDTGLAAPSQWDLVSDKQMMQEEQPLQVARCTKIISPNTEDAKYVINVKQIAKFVVGLGDKVSPTDIEEGMRVGVDRNKYQIQIPLPPKIDPSVTMMTVEEKPDVTYNDVGGCKEQIEKMREVVELPMLHPEKFVKLGIDPPKGVLCYGPPGTGKTLLARAVANRTDACFIRVIGSELVQKYVGEGARMVRELFQMARSKKACIVFFDEVDAIGGARFDDGVGGDNEVQRTMLEIVNQLDGFDARGNIKVLMATNRPDTLDPALLRPGRLDRKVEFGLPDLESRTQIFKIHTRTMNCERDIRFELLARLCPNSTGADIRSVCTEAGMYAIRARRKTVTEKDFLDAVNKVIKGYQKFSATPKVISEKQIRASISWSCGVAHLTKDCSDLGLELSGEEKNTQRTNLKSMAPAAADNEDDIALLKTYGLGPYSTSIKKAEKEIKEMAKKINNLCGIKESDTGLAAPSQWDLVSDKQMMQAEQPLQVARCTKIISPNTEDAKYVINVKQIAKNEISVSLPIDQLKAKVKVAGPRGEFWKRADIRSVCTEAGMYAIRARRKNVCRERLLDAVNKVIKGYQKFSATPKYMVYN
ncbi:hypothetical protein KY285_029283 [Solanum tuberosum]|nr:hypothetical protein KY289_029418 [Solanum tuberosum]KAH0668077.1 hypothetical protein KY285_029283 [Solanum tuberosum]